MGVQIFPNRKGQLLGVVGPIEKHCKLLLQCMQQKSHNGIRVTAAADWLHCCWLASVTLTCPLEKSLWRFGPLSNRLFTLDTNRTW